MSLSDKDPDFLERLYTIPLQAFIPRFLWSGKPLENIGGWFTQQVWGYPLESSTAMSPIGFLYFAQGNIFIAIFFFIFGFLQKFLRQFLKEGAGGILIFFGFLTSLVLIDSTVNTIFVSFLRTFPMLLILQYIVYKK